MNKSTGRIPESAPAVCSMGRACEWAGKGSPRPQMHISSLSFPLLYNGIYPENLPALAAMRTRWAPAWAALFGAFLLVSVPGARSQVSSDGTLTILSGNGLAWRDTSLGATSNTSACPVYVSPCSPCCTNFACRFVHGG